MSHTEFIGLAQRALARKFLQMGFVKKILANLIVGAAGSDALNKMARSYLKATGLPGPSIVKQYAVLLG